MARSVTVNDAPTDRDDLSTSRLPALRSTRTVLHVSHEVDNGLAHCVGDYVAEQVGQGFVVVVACPGGRLGELSRKAGATVVPWLARRRPGADMVGEMASLRRIVRQHEPDVVHLHSAKAGLAGRMVLRGVVPTVYSPHGWSFLGADGMLARTAREWERFAARWSSVTVCASEAETTTARRHGIHGRIVTVPHQLDEQCVAAIEDLVLRYRAQVRSELGVSAGQPLAVCAGRLSHQKGQDVVVRAWPRVREVVSTAEIVLIGAGPDAVALYNASSPGVRLVGPLEREATLRWMFAADVVICPSRWEGMSMAAVEALALGRAVIASDVDGMAELVPGGAGWIVNPGDVGGLAQAAIKVLADPAVAFDAGQIARNHTLKARQHQTGPTSAAHIATLYRELTPR